MRGRMRGTRGRTCGTRRTHVLGCHAAYSEKVGLLADPHTTENPKGELRKKASSQSRSLASGSYYIVTCPRLFEARCFEEHVHTHDLTSSCMAFADSVDSISYKHGSAAVMQP